MVHERFKAYGQLHARDTEVAGWGRIDTAPTTEYEPTDALATSTGEAPTSQNGRRARTCRATTKEEGTLLHRGLSVG